MTKHIVFVYGTLKRGEPNHHHMTLGHMTSDGQSRYVGTVRTVHKWPMVVAGNFKIPYLLYRRGTGKKVIGELYEVDDLMLRKLDRLEGHPLIYERDSIQVQRLDEEEEEEMSSVKQWLNQEDITVDNQLDLHVCFSKSSDKTWNGDGNDVLPTGNVSQSGIDVTHQSEANLGTLPARPEEGVLTVSTYFMKRFRPSLLQLTFIDDYKFEKHGRVKLPEALSGEEIKQELALVMADVFVPSKL